MEAMQQMNVRIPPKLKQEGDSVLARLGFSPSEGIRRIYESLVRNQNDKEALNTIMGTSITSDEDTAERERRRAEFLEFPKRVERELAALGIDLKKSRLATATKEDLREMYIDAIEERMIERGLL